MDEFFKDILAAVLRQQSQTQTHRLCNTVFTISRSTGHL